MPPRFASCYHVGMPRKPTPAPDDPEQSKRFIKAAREIGTNESPEEFERVFRKVVTASRSQGNAGKPKASRMARKAKG